MKNIDWFGKSMPVMALIMCVMLIWSADVEGRRLQENVAEKILRFHVRANSDSEFDQNLKLCARDAVIAYLEDIYPQDIDLEEAKRLLAQNFMEIQTIVEDVAKSFGKDYTAKVYFSNEYFPAKVYGNVMLPPGMYHALRIDIGKAKGKNWWCILYPSMCFVESTHAQCEEYRVQSVLTDEEYDYVTGYKIRFKYLTFLNPKEEQKVSEVENATGSTDIY